MTMHPTHLRSAAPLTWAPVVVLGLTATLSLAACSAASSASPPSSPTTVSQQGSGSGGSGAGSGGQGRAGGGFGRAPGVSGLVAAITASTAQVQSASSQTAVTWTPTTAVTSQVTIKASALRIGDCVVARAGQAPRPRSPSAPATPSTTPSRSGSITATTVEVFAATGGSCTAAGAVGFGGGRRPTGSGTGVPTERPTFTGQPGGSTPGGSGRAFGGFGNFGGFGGFGGAAIGRVSALSSSSLTVTPVARSAASATGTPSVAAPSPVTVSWTSTTTFTTRKRVTSTAIVVGVCVTAQGRTDDTGALTATAIEISQTVNGACSTRPGFRGRGGSSAATPTTAGALNG